jgi:hypothetical protein
MEGRKEERQKERKKGERRKDICGRPWRPTKL